MFDKTIVNFKGAAADSLSKQVRVTVERPRPDGSIQKETYEHFVLVGFKPVMRNGELLFAVQSTSSVVSLEMLFKADEAITDTIEEAIDKAGPEELALILPIMARKSGGRGEE